MQPHLNVEGKRLIDGFFHGIADVRRFAQAGNIKGLIANFTDYGVPGLKTLSTLAPERFRNAIEECVTNCERVLDKLRRLKSGKEADKFKAGSISCHVLDRNAIIINNAIYGTYGQGRKFDFD